MTLQNWQDATIQVRDRLGNVFSEYPKVELIYHEGDYADNYIAISDLLMLYLIEKEVPRIGGVETQYWWQLSRADYIPATYHDPPDCDVVDMGEPHRTLDKALREAVKYLAEWRLDMYLEGLANDADARFYEGPHSWKPINV